MGHNFLAGPYYENKCKCDSCVRDRLDLHAKVSRGAELLDEAVPDWYLNVNVEKLDMDTAPFASQRARGVKHLLVQVLGSPEVTQAYQAMEILFGMDFHTTGKDCGFCPDGRHGHPALNKVWVDTIVRRHVELV
jgi:hypothetical protein